MTAKEERIEELELRLSELERFIWFEENEIIKTEKKIQEAQLRLERLNVQKINMENKVKEYEGLLKATKARLSVWNEG